MKFIRRSLTLKVVLLFSLFAGALSGVGIYLYRHQIDQIPVDIFLSAMGGFMMLMFMAFLFDVIIPLKRVIKQVRNLLSGKNYQRVVPLTIDEIGTFTHFFNEITKDLEKISAEVRERRRMSSELDIASQIQRDVLPTEAPAIKGLDVVAKTRSAAEVGGDSFDMILSSDQKNAYFYIGDVTGHGVPSGLVMMMVDTLITTMIAMNMLSSRDILVNTNYMLSPRISARLFMTLVMLRWDIANQKMYYTGAGHEHILVFRAKDERVDAIRAGGIALGMIPDNSKILKEQEIPLEVGDAILLYTDGLTEARNKSGEMYDLKGMTNSFKRHGYLPSADAIFDRLTKDFSNFVGEYKQIDDTTMIVIKYTGEAGTKMKLQIGAEQTHWENKKWDWGE